MKKDELAKYAGVEFWNMSRRMGAVRGTIYCLTKYEVTERGTCRYLGEWMGCVANKYQYEEMEELTHGLYHWGRPSAKTLSAKFLEKVKTARTVAEAVTGAEPETLQKEHGDKEVYVWDL